MSAIDILIGRAWRGETGPRLQEAYDAALREVTMSETISEAGNAWSDIAASAYRAYAASTGNKNFRGEPMPEFVALPQSIKTAWEVAVRHACDCLKCPAGELPDEQHWAGWVPPQA